MHQPQETTAVIYHANCADGFGAAWSAWQLLGEKASYFPASYGDAPPVLHPWSRVVIADFSYPRPLLKEILGRVASLVVLDHHKTAEEDLRGFPGAFFDMDHSGAYLAWSFFHAPDIPPPSLISYVEDRDLWKFKLPYSKEVSAYIQSFDFSFERWDEISRYVATYMNDIVREGQAILRAKEQMVKQMAKNHRFRKIGEYEVPVANAACYFSEVGEELCRLFPDHPFAAYYFDRADNRRQWGLRSRNGFDVSVIAKQLGGGGHPAAAGFTQSLSSDS